ncbi:MmyB family transcriptional regulator [Streptomyces sp. NPDC001443]
MNIDGSSPQVAHQTITRILRRARLRADPGRLPGAIADRVAQDRRGLTQEDVARALGISKRWYRNLELGKPHTYSTQMLESVRRILDLSDDEWDTVWQLASGRTIAPLPQVRTVPPPVAQFVEAQKWPAFAYDHRWDLLAFNHAASRHCPWVHHESNILSWVLTTSEAREQLVSWESDWALPLLARLRFLAELRKDDLRLQALVRIVQTDPVARKLWNSTDLPNPAPGPVTSTRRVRLPREGTPEAEVTVLRATVYDAPSCWLTIIMPT